MRPSKIRVSYLEASASDTWKPWKEPRTLSRYRCRGHRPCLGFLSNTHAHAHSFKLNDEFKKREIDIILGLGLGLPYHSPRILGGDRVLTRALLEWLQRNHHNRVPPFPILRWSLHHYHLLLQNPFFLDRERGGGIDMD